MAQGQIGGEIFGGREEIGIDPLAAPFFDQTRGVNPRLRANAVDFFEKGGGFGQDNSLISPFAYRPRMTIA
jgi:hypothetical protein